MMPIDFKEANATLGKPNSMDDDQCFSIRALIGTDEDGLPYICTLWKPNKEDIDAIKAGQPIIVKIIGLSMPPLVLATTDKYGNLNQ